MEYFCHDPNTRIILGYMEGVADGRRFFNVAREVSKKKPVLLWKGGVSSVGSRSAASHTGAIAGSSRVWNALFKQTGMVQVGSEEEMLDLLQAFHYLPLPRGKRVAIVSSTGGMGVALADTCSEYGLEVAPLSHATLKRLREIVPSIGTCIHNPVDLGMMSSFNVQLSVEAIEVLAADDKVDIIFKSVGGSSAEYIRKEAAALKGFDKPIMLITNPAMNVRMEEIKPVKGVAVYRAGRRAALVASKMVQYQRYLSE